MPYLVQNQQTYSGMNEHAKASYRMTFPKMFPDYALGKRVCMITVEMKRMGAGQERTEHRASR